MNFRRHVQTVAVGLLLAIPSVSYADVVISSAQTQNMSCVGGVCAPTAQNAVLNVGDLETLLGSGSVEVTTTGSGVQANNIDLDAGLTWSGTGALTLDAYQSISTQKAVTVGSSGGLTVITNDGGSNGTFSFGPKGSVTFQNLSSPLIINGTTYTLVKSLPALAAAVKANSSGAYALAGSYDASKDGVYRTPPIASLSGVIEGLGNTLSHVSIKVRKRYIAASLVEEVEQTGAISNLRLARIRYNATGKYADSGGLVENNYGYLFDDAVSGSIDANGRVGGDAGGFVNFNNSGGLVIACSADVTITTSGDGGGGSFVDGNFGTIILSRATGSFSGGVAGGFVGLNEGTLSQDFATGAVSGGEAGGFAGNNETDGNDIGTIENSYSTGAVTGGEAGGFISQNAFPDATVSTSYSTGAVPNEAGGFVCDGYPSDFSDDYWDTTTSGTTYGVCFDVNGEQITGLTSQQLRSGLPAGFDPSIWAEDKKINNGFPYLIANPPPR